MALALLLLTALLPGPGWAASQPAPGAEAEAVSLESAANAGRTVVVVPVQGDIEHALTFLIRRGVKQAIDSKAAALVLDMDTNGGRVDATEEIMQILQRFEPQDQTYTLIDTKAFSAGAFISAGTRHIYMTPGSVIGAATPVLMGGGEMPEAVQEKMNSAMRGLVRAAAERHGHRPEVFDAMIDRTLGLAVEGKQIVEKGKVLTLTSKEAGQPIGKPPKPLLSAGTVASLEQMLEKAGLAGARVVRIEEGGFESAARWIVMIGPVLLLAGIVGVYVELKSPGFGLPGLAGILCLITFFFGHQIAGLSGSGPLVFFCVGLAMVLVEVFFVPGAGFLGLAGAIVMIGAMLFAMVDRYPADPAIPTLDQLKFPLAKLAGGLAGAGVTILLLTMFLPRTPLFQRLAVQSASGANPFAPSHAGETGVAETRLCPGGKVRFGDRLDDVVADGGFIEAGATVKVITVEGTRVVVDKA